MRRMTAGNSVSLKNISPAAPWALLLDAAANFCLFSYALINQLFCGGLLVPNSPPKGAGDVLARVQQALLVLAPLTVMYSFSPRILFLAEEIEDPRTRPGMGLAVLTVAFRRVVGADAGGWWLA